MAHIVSAHERLAALRRRARIGQREVAALAGVYQVDISDIECGRRPVSARVKALLDAWEAAGIEIGRPVPKITYTRGWPFDGERRKR